MKYVIRSLEAHEYAVLNDFLYEAIYIPEGTEAPPRSVLELPELQVYIEGFGTSKDDHALAAMADEQIVGVVWTRIMNDYGHIDEDTPSLSISVLEEYRGAGIGTALLDTMLSNLASCGYAQVSLSVQKENFAVKMYEKAGFTVYSEREEEYIMHAPLCRSSE